MSLLFVICHELLACVRLFSGVLANVEPISVTSGSGAAFIAKQTQPIVNDDDVAIVWASVA